MYKPPSARLLHPYPIASQYPSYLQYVPRYIPQYGTHRSLGYHYHLPSLAAPSRSLLLSSMTWPIEQLKLFSMSVAIAYPFNPEAMPHTCNVTYDFDYPDLAVYSVSAPHKHSGFSSGFKKAEIAHRRQQAWADIGLRIPTSVEPWPVGQCAEMSSFPNHYHRIGEKLSSEAGSVLRLISITMRVDGSEETIPFCRNCRIYAMQLITRFPGLIIIDGHACTKYGPCSDAFAAKSTYPVLCA